MSSDSLSFSSDEPAPKKRPSGGGSGVMIDLLDDSPVASPAKKLRTEEAKHQEEDESSSIDVSKYFIPLSVQRERGLKEHGRKISISDNTPIAAPKARKAPASKPKRGRAAYAKRKPAAKKKAAVQAENDSPVKRSKNDTADIRSFGRVDSAKSARDHFVAIRTPFTKKENPGADEHEIASLVSGLWQSLESHDIAPYAKLEEMDRRRESAERRK